MIQKYSGKNTCVNSKKLPIIFKHADLSADVLLDFGCGIYIDHVCKYVNSLGMQYLPYDPFNQAEGVNHLTMDIVRHRAINNLPVDIICSNVLNVIAEKRLIKAIAVQLMNIADMTGGKLFVTVAFDKRRRSGLIRPDQYQRNEPIENYLRYFPGASILYRVLRYEGGKNSANRK